MLIKEWAHPFFVSIGQPYRELAASLLAHLPVITFVFRIFGKSTLLCGPALAPTELVGHKRTLDTGASAPLFAFASSLLTLQTLHCLL